AHEAAGVALALRAHDRAAVPAGVEQAVVLALLVTHENDRPAGDPARAEVAPLLELGGVPDIDPAAAEDLRPFPAQDVLADQNLAVEQEGLLLAIIDDVGTGGHARPSLGASRQAYKGARNGVNVRRTRPGEGRMAGCEWWVAFPSAIGYSLFANRHRPSRKRNYSPCPTQRSAPPPLCPDTAS